MAGGIIGNLMFAVGFKFKNKGLTDADKGVKGLTKSVVGLGLAAGSAMVAIGAAGIAAASKFEEAMLTVQGATGQTADQMEATREVAKSLYSKNFGEDWQDLGSAISTVSQVTKQTGAELENTTRNALLLRDTFGFDINESIKSVDTMMKQFGITSENAMNLIAQGTNAGLNKSGELIDSANEYANQFKSLGFTAEEMFGVFASGSAEGVFQLDKVGDAVKEFNIRSKDMSASSIEAYQMLGLNADEMMQTFAAGGPKARKAFSQIVSMISDVEDPVAKNTIAGALMGSQFEDLEATVISAMGQTNDQFDMTKNSMDALNEIKFKKPMEAFKMFGRQFEVGILIPIGEKLLPVLNGFGKWLTDHQPQIEAVGEKIGTVLGDAIRKVGTFLENLMPTFQAMADEAKAAFDIAVAAAKDLWDNIEPLATLVGGLLLEGFQAIWPEVQNLYNQFASIVSTFVQWEGFTPIVIGLGTAILTYKGYMFAAAMATKIQALWTTRATLATKLLGIAMSLNPIGLIVAAVIGLAVAFVVAYKKSDKFRAFIDRIWAWIKNAFAKTMEFFRVTVPKIFNGIVDWIKLWGPRILAVITGPIGLVVYLVIRYWDKIKAFTVKVFTAVWNWIKDVWGRIKSSIVNTIDRIRTGIKTGWNKVKSVTTKVFTGIWNWMKKVWTQIKDAVMVPINYMVNTTFERWNKIKSVIQTVVTAVWEWLKRTWESIKTSVSNAATAIWDAITAAWNRVKESTSSVFTAIWDWLVGIWGNIKTSVSNAATAIWDKITEVWENIKGSISGAMDKIKIVVSNAWDSIKDGIGEVGEKIKEKLNSVWDGVKNSFRNAISWIIDKLNDAITTINDKLSFKLPDIFGDHEISVNIPTIPTNSVDGSHANGLAKVPWDNYIARLHKDERVLTAQENEAYTQGTAPVMPQATYTPEQAPARSQPSASNSKHEIALKIDFTGQSPGKMDGPSEARVKEIMTEAFESAMRRMGLEASYGNN